MKKIIILKITILWLFSCVFATVGWPSTISDIYYNKNNNTYRYAIIDYWWRWWSFVYENDINKNTKKIIKKENENFETDWLFIWDESSLEDILKESDWIKLNELKLNELAINFELRLVNFNKLNENLDTIKTNVYKYDPNSLEYFMPWDIINYIRENRTYISWDLQSKTEITTCRLDNVNYRWLSLPWNDFIIIIVSTNKWDCFEGGYIKEDIYTIKYDNIPQNIFLDENTKIINYEHFDWQWPQMNKSTWWVFIQLTEEDFKKWVNQDRGNDKTKKSKNLWETLIIKLKKIIKLIFS